MSFVQFHIHGMIGSPLDGISTSEEYAKRAKELGHPALALTDHGKMSGFYEHQVACLKNGIKPIFGVEAYIETKLLRVNEEGKRERNKNMHVVILAKNNIGYKNLLKLNYISNADTDHFYYRNHITVEELFENKEGLIVGSGCMNSPFSRAFREGNKEVSEKLFKAFCENFGDDFYVEIQMNELVNPDQINGFSEGQKSINEWMISLAKKYNKKILITGDVHYAKKGQDQLQTLGIAMKNGEKIGSMTWEIESKNLYYHDIQDYIDFNKQWGYGYTEEEIKEWCSNTLYIAEKCNYLIPERNRMILPELSDDDDQMIINLTKNNLCQKFNVSSFSEVPQNYQDRLNMELDVIIRKGMSSYILILEDIFSFCNQEKIIRGPARGSGGGSLILYALGITKLDPIKYDLLFERFLSQSRAPDMVYDFFGEYKE